MPGKQAKILAADQIDNLLLFAETTRYPHRDRVIVLLSVKAPSLPRSHLSVDLPLRISSRRS
jgi:hypothetical protein